ncbi:MAG: hypothetical protein IK151_03325 [Erysipelotrichaceae bacterium]|nr:hypothetical protein [Erysipelotrichaceae bacterium]
MDYINEKNFVNSFIRKERRERLLHEFTNPSKRNAALNRFCHNADDLLDKKRIIMQGDDMDRRKEFMDFISEHEEICFVMSDDYLGEGFMPLNEAVKLASCGSEAVLIMGNNFAVVFTEAMKGGRNKYLLFHD